MVSSWQGTYCIGFHWQRLIYTGVLLNAQYFFLFSVCVRSQRIRSLKQTWKEVFTEVRFFFLRKIYINFVDYNAFCGPFNEGILIAVLKAFQCAPWVSWGFAMASFHSVWVSALLVFNVYQVRECKLCSERIEE